MDQDLHIAVEAVILSEQLLLKPVQQRGIQGLNSLLVNYEHASKLIIDYAPAFVGPDSHIAEFKRPNFLIVLVEHVVKVLLDVVEVEENA